MGVITIAFELNSYVKTQNVNICSALISIKKTMLIGAYIRANNVIAAPKFMRFTN